VAIEFAIHHAENAIAERNASLYLVDHLDRAFAAQYDQNSLAQGFLLSDGKARNSELYGAATKLFANETAAARDAAADDADMTASIDAFAAADAAWQREIGDQEMKFGADPQKVQQAIDIAKSQASIDAMKPGRAAGAAARAKAETLSAAGEGDLDGALWWVHLAQIIGGLIALMVAVYAGYQLERRIAFPIRVLNDCMKKLAQGRIDVSVPPLGEGDEIAEMAQRVQVFKENAVEKARLETEAEAARKAARSGARAAGNRDAALYRRAQCLRRVDHGGTAVPFGRRPDFPSLEGLHERIRKDPHQFQRLDRKAPAGDVARQHQHDGDPLGHAGNLLRGGRSLPPHRATGREPRRNGGGTR
jgi:methyl-accepting chemotaxis protein